MSNFFCKFKVKSTGEVFDGTAYDTGPKYVYMTSSGTKFQENEVEIVDENQESEIIEVRQKTGSISSDRDINVPRKDKIREDTPNVIFETVFGSHIYGTNTPNSDMDYKGVFIETPRNIILDSGRQSIVSSSKVKKEIGIRNSKEDIDREFKELRRFIDDCLNGQTYAIDMLYSPPSLWVKTSPTWEFIVYNREKFLSKNVNAFIGYCNQQASKYGLKGSRLGTVLKAIETLKKFPPASKLKENPRIEGNEFCEYKRYEHKRNNELVVEEMLVILGKMYSPDTRVKLILASLERFRDFYGERAVMAAKNEGIDFKAISHAYRCCYQLIELATKGRIDFPLKQAPYLIDIKLGNVSWPKKVQDELPNLMTEAIATIKASSLPEHPDRQFWDNFVYNTYLKDFKNEN